MQQIQSIISPKYQTVIPAQIRRVLQLKAGERLLWHVIQTDTTPKIIAEPIPKSWANYARGLGKALWQNVDINTYIKNLRSQWQNQK